jgi:hypothetical protein
MKETGADQLRGTAKRTAERAIDKEVTQFGKTFERDVRAKTQAFQRAQQAKAQKGTTPGSRAKMAADVARRPRVQGPKPPATTTTGTRRVAANPPTNSGRGVRGRVIEPYKPKNTKGSVGSPTTIRSKPAPSSDPITNKKITPRNSAAPLRNNTSRGNNPINLTEAQVRQGQRDLGRKIYGPERPPSRPKPDARTVRQPKGGNPAETFSKATKAKASAPPKNLTREQQRELEKKFTLNHGTNSTDPRIKTDDAFAAGEGLNVRRFEVGKRGGIQPVDGRGSSTPKYRQPTTNPLDPRKNGRRVTSDQQQFYSAATKTKGVRKDPRPVARLGQPVPRNGFNTNNPVVQQRAKAAKAAEKALPKQQPKAPTPPKRTPEQQAALRRQSRRNTEAARQAITNDPKKSAQLQRDYNSTLKRMEEVDRLTNPDYTGVPRPAPATTSSGEVRLQGSAKGNQHMTGIDSGSRDGKVPKTGPHDGTVSRQVATKQATDADRKAVRAIRARNASNKANAVVNAAKKGVDRFGNNLQKTADDLLRSIGWTGN